MNLKRTRNKLLKNGFISKCQTNRHDQWIDLLSDGRDISFYHNGEMLDGAIKVHGRLPDEPQFDQFYSNFTRNVKLAISLSRI
ncbi:MAG TPA: hypothetical protein EYQ00_09395 [Dehalococcoidia bacterium]|jgi:hypothetical protein|nr:hypothetical protein [Dehalococcoidia bacterium]